MFLLIIQLTTACCFIHEGFHQIQWKLLLRKQTLERLRTLPSFPALFVVLFYFQIGKEKGGRSVEGRRIIFSLRWTEFAKISTLVSVDSELPKWLSLKLMCLILEWGRRKEIQSPRKSDFFVAFEVFKFNGNRFSPPSLHSLFLQCRMHVPQLKINKPQKGSGA